jgi:hypothetical protein
MDASSTLRQMFQRAGFTLVRCTNHAIWRCPCGHAKVTAARTPGKGRRAHDNARALMTRTLNECNRLNRSTT